MDRGAKVPFNVGHIEAINVTESVGKIFKLTNVDYIPSPGKEVINVPGKTMFVRANYYIWHLLFDEIAAYLYMKKYVKDLNLIWVYEPDIQSNTKKDFLEEIKTRSFHEENSSETEVHKYFEDIMKMFPGQEYIFSPKERTTNYHFDEVYLVWDPIDFFVEKKHIFLQLGSHWSGTPYAWWARWNWQDNDKFNGNIFDHQWWRLIGISEMRRIFLKELESYPVLPYKKIFISRKDADQRYKKQIGDEFHLSFFRYVDPDINDMIENYYVERGYHSVNFEGMSYLNQLNYIRNATHVAGLVGSGFTSLYVAKPGCQVIEILVNKKYGFTYDFLAKLVPFRLTQIDLRMLLGDTERLKEVFELKNNYINSLEGNSETHSSNN